MWKLVKGLVVAIWLAGPAHAQEASKCDGSLPPASLSLSGSEKFLLRAPPTGGQPETQYLYLHIDPMPAPFPSTVCVTRVAHDGKDRPDLRNAIKLTPALDNGLPRIAIDVARYDDFRATGEWKITGVLDLPKPGARSQFSFVLVRRPAVLQIPANLKLRVANGEVSPPNFPVNEVGSESGVARLNISLDPIVSPDTGNATLTFENVSLKPGEMAVVVPKASGVLPLGTSSSKLTFAAPELVAPLVLNVELIRRLSDYWLLLALACGLISSLVFRQWLTARNALDEARLAAASEMMRIVGLAEQELDPVVRKALAGVAHALEGTYTFERTKAAINSAVTQRNAEADRIVADATSRRAKLRQDWDGLRKTYGPAVPIDPALAGLTNVVLRRLGEIGHAIHQNWLFEPERQLQEATDTLIPQLGMALMGWRATLKSALDELVRWNVPGVLSDEAKRLSDAAGTAPDPTATPADILAKANKLALEVRAWLDQRADRQRAQEMALLEPDLKAANLNALAVTWANDATQLLSRPSRPSSFSDLADAVRQTGRHRAALFDILWSSAAPAVRAALLTDRLPDALKAQAGALAPAPPVPGPGPLSVGPPLAAAGALEAVYVPPITLPVAADYVIVSPPLITVGTKVTLRLMTARPLDATDVVHWTGANREDALAATITPGEPGFIDVSCEVRDSKDNLLGSARTVLLVAGGGTAESVVGWYRRLDWQNGVGTAFSALVALGSGYVMLEGTWIGRPDQWVTAFLWGLVVDLGLAKAADIAKPLAQRVTVPTKSL